MVQYRVQDPEGNEHVIDGPEGATPDQIMGQAQALIPQKKAPQWSDLPGNVWEGIKETPQTIKGIVQAPYQIGQALGKTAEMMTQPASVMPGVEGPKFSDTPIAKMGESIASGVGHAITHPKETIIEHPISTAATVAPFLGQAGKLAGFGRAAKVAEEAGAAGKAAEAAGATAEGLGGAAKAAEGAAGAAKAADPLAAVKEYVTKKYGQAAEKPGFNVTAAKYLQEEARNLGAKELGLQPRMIQSMGPGLQGPERAGALVDYAFEKGYIDPATGSIGRKEAVLANMKKAGNNVEAIRKISDTRGAPPIQDIAQQVYAQLNGPQAYGPGSVTPAAKEIKNVMKAIQNAPPTHEGLADLATRLNAAKTNVKSLGQHPGPTTDAANIISKMNNDSIRSVLNPQESELYSQSLRDYGAHKKLEQGLAAAERRGMGARSNQRGLLGRMWQEALDRAGYRLGANVAQRTAKSILKNPQATRTLPDFFEEFAHQTGDVVDEALGLGE